MAVHHALGIAGGAARVTHRHAGALVEVGVLEAGLLGVEQGVVVERVAERRRVAGTLHDDVLRPVVNWSRTLASNGMIEASTMMTSSSAWLMT